MIGLGLLHHRTPTIVLRRTISGSTLLLFLGILASTLILIVVVLPRSLGSLWSLTFEFFLLFTGSLLGPLCGLRSLLVVLWTWILFILTSLVAIALALSLPWLVVVCLLLVALASSSVVLHLFCGVR